MMLSYAYLNINNTSILTYKATLSCLLFYFATMSLNDLWKYWYMQLFVIDLTNLHVMQ